MEPLSLISIDLEVPLISKDEGAGVMISAFQSREFGFSLELSDEDLAKVNAYRKDKNYRDKDAATYIHGKAEKRPLDSTPFYRELQYGSNLDGYWCYEHMVLQLEDCIDVLQAIHGELYEYVFLFDHSCGHDRKRADGLDARLIRKNFSGKQPRMHPSRIAPSRKRLSRKIRARREIQRR